MRQSRRGEVVSITKNENSKTVRAGDRTFFFDVEKTSEGKPYLKITESRFKGEDKERERSSIFIFSEDAKKFAQAVSEMTKRLA
jgi:hypothetical protein